MRLRNVKGAKQKLMESPITVNEPKEYKGKWKLLFNNENPIHIEIGMGKGKFISELAKRNPNINYIGIEKFDSVLVRAVENTDKLDNLYFIRFDALELEQIFEKGEINRVYLNFSDPWPKARHAKRRLTHATFLNLYRSILDPQGEINFKTDNQGLFEFSIESMCNYGCLLSELSLDLHNSDIEDNIMTEYEEKFSSLGFRIYRVVAKFRSKGEK